VPEVRIPAESRTEFGKGAARRIRRANKVPAVVYGHGTDPQHVTLPGHDLMLALKTSNALLSLDLEGGRTLVLPKSVQRHPIRGHLEHVDLVIVKRGEKVSVDVPIRVTGEVDSSGMLDVQMVTLTVLAEATSIPTSFEIDVEGYAIGRSVHASDVELPEGVELDADPDAMVMHVVPSPTAAQFEAELADAEADAGIEHEVSDADAEAGGGASGGESGAGSSQG
jgi:large subunit ribosomal protein L25